MIHRENRETDRLRATRIEFLGRSIHYTKKPVFRHWWQKSGKILPHHKKTAEEVLLTY